MQTYQTETVDRATPGISVRAAAETIQFGRFRVLPGSRLLLLYGQEVPIGGRAFDLLIALLRVRGQLVDKNEIARNVWPSTTVDESNIRFQVASLRKTLGPEGELIKTIPGRGYLLAEPDGAKESPLSAPQRLSPAHSVFPGWLKSNREPITPEEQYVALVDDDVSVLEALAGLIRSTGSRVETFQSTRAFLQSDQVYPPICIVLDAWLPGQGGLDFQDKLLRAGANVPIIFISGHADIAMSVRAIKAGAADFLTKPVRYEDLLNAIRLAVAASASPV
jgi:DNA-binding response OmpR family regulator